VWKLLDAGEATVAPVIVQELLQGATDAAGFANLHRLNPVSTQQHEQTFPRKRIFTMILNLRCKSFIYNRKVGRLATELAV
jgi:hypothetical protein